VGGTKVLSVAARGRRRTVTGPWPVVEEQGTAAELHGDRLPVPGHRLVRVATVVGPALVLGSTQLVESVDSAVAERLGLEVVRRRSGGGAVLVRPAHQVWLDVCLPRPDPLWDDDVGRSAHWLGGAMAAAVRSLGVPGAAAHRGRFEPTPWSPLVCFAGRAPGEVVVGGRKVVGTSQRRTRDGAVFQVAVALVWEPEALVPLLRLPTEAAAAIRQTGMGLADLVPGVTAADVVRAVVASLPADPAPPELPGQRAPS
jgi:lipoate-protein ligase A